MSDLRRIAPAAQRSALRAHGPGPDRRATPSMGRLSASPRRFDGPGGKESGQPGEAVDSCRRRAGVAWVLNRDVPRAAGVRRQAACRRVARDRGSAQEGAAGRSRDRRRDTGGAPAGSDHRLAGRQGRTSRIGSSHLQWRSMRAGAGGPRDYDNRRSHQPMLQYRPNLRPASSNVPTWRNPSDSCSAIDPGFGSAMPA